MAGSALGGGSKPLDGLRVLDFSRLVPGPYCTLLLGDLGAEVVRVEDTAGDLLRYLPSLVDGVGAVFAALNRNKQSVALNLKHESGQTIAQELAARSDIVVEGFRPGVASRLKIDFTTLAGRNPRLVYCSISGFGQESALRSLPGHDLTYAALTGLLDALCPGTPRVPGVQVVDAAAALLAAVRILAALRAAGSGPQYLDVSLLQAARALMPAVLAEEALDRPQKPSLIDLLRGSERYGLYRCADGRWLALTPLEEAFWQRLCAFLEKHGWITRNGAPSTETLGDVFQLRNCDDWFRELSAADIPCAPVRTVQEAAAHGIDAGTDGAGSHGTSPRHGEHTGTWLAALGYSSREIEQLAAERVISL